MARVFIPQIPSRFDTAAGAWMPTVNIEPAKKFGELHVMLPPEANRLELTTIVGLLKRMMADFGPKDYLVALGDPSVIALSAVMAERAAGRLRLLKWDRMQRDYILMETAI